MAINFFNTFSIGSQFHNENGEDYIILAMDEKKDKAILFRKTELGTPYFVGARFMSLYHWGQGHYFLEDAVAAFEWFENEEEEKENNVLVKQFLELLDDDEYEVWFYDDSVDEGEEIMIHYHMSFIPKELLMAKIFQIELLPKEDEDTGFQTTVIAIDLKSEYNPEIKKYFNQFIRFD